MEILELINIIVESSSNVILIAICLYFFAKILNSKTPKKKKK